MEHLTQELRAKEALVEERSQLLVQMAQRGTGPDGRVDSHQIAGLPPDVATTVLLKVSEDRARENDALLGRLAVVEMESAKDCEIIASTTQELHTCRSSERALGQQVEVMQAERSVWEGEIAALTQKVKEGRAARQSLSTELDSTRGEAEELGKELEEKAARLSTVEDAFVAALMGVEHARSELDKLRIGVAAAQNELHQMQVRAHHKWLQH